MLNIFKKSIQKVFGSKYDRDVKGYMPIVDQINDHFASYQNLSNDELRAKTDDFRKRISDYLSDVDQEIEGLRSTALASEDFEEKENLYNTIDSLREERNEKHLKDILDQILPEAFAVVKETARRFTQNDQITVTASEYDRELAAGQNYVSIEGDQAIWSSSWQAAGGDITWNMIHYDVQLIGGMVLHDGKIAEMQTGEGKTLVATLPAYLNGLSGEGVNVVTVNDYLARRDCEWIGPVMQFLGLTIECIDRYRPHSPERRAAYACDITYGTNNEFGFDYLRDNMVRSKKEQVQRGYNYCIVDEIDSVLIDDARTPLIISGPVPTGDEEQEYNELKPKVERVLNAQKKLATEYLATAKKLFAEGDRGIEEGEAGMALLRAFHAMPNYRPLIKYLSEEGVKVLLQKTENHYMQEQSKRMYLVDDPLYFVIDEKNRSVELTEKGSEYLAKGLSDDQFFVMPDIATGMMEIEQDDTLDPTERQEKKSSLISDYSVKARRLHSTKQLLKAYTMFEKDVDYVVMDGQVKIVDEQTGRMMEGRRYSDGLHQALEAKENVKVGEITQTYATVTLQNFFRMFTKRSGMTGTALTEAKEFWDIYKLDVVAIPTNKPIIRDDRDDLVYKTAREKYNAVIDDIVQLTEQGRPVLVGTTSVDISEKLSRMLDLRKIKHNVLNAKQHQREAEVVANAGLPGAVTIATNMAGRGTDIKLKQEILDAGGLAIIGTERHDSRRVDRQLRGRAGRQGDPGSSQFYVSLEDKLMRLFHSERIAKLMDRMGHQDGEVIQHGMVTKSIERAQIKVEENNYGIRKRLLEYDDVMNIQREAIYKKRENALTGERLSMDMHNTFMQLAENVVYEYKEHGDYDAFRDECLRVLGFDPEMDQNSFAAIDAPQLVLETQKMLLDAYKQKGEQLKHFLVPRIKDIIEREGDRYKRIQIPFTDGLHRGLNISADMRNALESEGDSLSLDIEKAVNLALIDENWKEHLRSMDELKESVQSASFEQKDPLVVYKVEAYELFENLIHKINEEVTSFLLNGRLFIKEKGLEQAKEQKTDLSKLRSNKAAVGADARAAAAHRAAAQAGQAERQKVETFIRQGSKVKRNDPCPCGSGKKYKQCHGK